MEIKDLKLKNDKYYYLCSAGLGDTMLVCGFLNQLKQQLGEIILLIRPSHEIVVKMYNIQNYIVVDFDDNISKELAKLCPTPQIGKIYPAHPAFHKQLWDFFKPIYFHNYSGFFMDWFKQFLNIDKDIEIQTPKYFPEISDKLSKKLENLPPLDKIILIIPDAKSVKPLTINYWNDLIKKLTNDGYTIVCNVSEEKDVLQNTIFLDLSVEEAVALALKCKHVYALRNGLCDLIYSKGKELTVFYPNHNTFAIYSINKMFNQTDINEQIILTLTSKDKYYKIFGIEILRVEQIGYVKTIKILGKTIWQKEERL